MFSLGGMEGIKGERSEQQSDRAENHHQNGLYLGRFDIEKVILLIKKCFVAIFKIVLRMQAGSTFSEKS